MPDHTHMIRQIQAFLDRTPITGIEAPAMIMCQQWLKTIKIVPTEPSPQVADTNEK